MFRSLIASLAVSAVFTTAAFADGISLDRPTAAASLHENGVDMVVYYTEAGDLLEVVATYLEPGAPEQPIRMRMGLADGDAVTFALPGLSATHYTFARTGSVVTVDATDTMLEFAVVE